MEIKAGLIGSTHSNSFLSESIQFFMRLWNYLRYKEPKSTPSSHSFMVLPMKLLGLQVVESNKNGPEIKQFDMTGYRNSKNVIWMEPKVPWTNDEIRRMVNRMKEFKHIPYDSLNFIYQMHMICSPEQEWKGPTGKEAEKAIYCSELVAYLLNSSGRKFFDKPWAVNPEDIK